MDKNLFKEVAAIGADVDGDIVSDGHGKNRYVNALLGIDLAVSESSFSFSIPNIDIVTHDNSIYPKEFMQKTYVEMIGKPIDLFGKPRLVKDVRVTNEFIFIDLKELSPLEKEIIDNMQKLECNIYKTFEIKSQYFNK